MNTSESPLARGAIDLGARAKFRLSGGDRLRYLNGQVSNDVRKATAGSAIAACVTTAKGKLDAVVHIAVAADGEAYLVDAAPELREPLAVRLGRYIIADDCALEDVTDACALIHVLGVEPMAGGIRNDSRFGGPGHDLWMPADGRGAALARLGVAGVPLLSDDAVEGLRVGRGIPEWGAELGEDTLPAEARLDTYAIDFHKGCYVGQEVISRIRSVGRVNRLLVRIRGEAELARGAKLVTPEGTEIGTVTSAVGMGGLGYVKRDFAAPGTRILSRVTEKTLPVSCQILEDHVP